MGYAILFVILGLGLLFAEVFIPSFGVLAACSLGSFILSVYFAFAYSAVAGWIFTAMLSIGVPIIGFFMVRFLIKSRTGRKIMLGPPERLEAKSKEPAELGRFVGKRGIAKTMLRPAGIVVVDGERVDAVTDGVMVAAGSEIEVRGVQGNQILVMPVGKNNFKS